jgi:hypothetical protein
MLYHLSHATSPFLLCIFLLLLLEIGAPFMPRLAWTVISLLMLPEHLRQQVHTTMPSFYWLRWGLANFLPGLASNCNPPDPCSSVARITDLRRYSWPRLGS